MREVLTALNDEEIVFYGRAVDQFDAPVANATVVGSIQINNGVRVGTDTISQVTDENGRFSISGYHGKNLGVSVRRDGYVIATTNTSFVYSYLWSEAERHSPDARNPVVIKMWKLQGAEPLAKVDQRYRFPYTNALVNIDLLSGRIVPRGGDIKILLNRSEGEISIRKQGYWSAQIEAVDGGLIEMPFMEARVTYALPSDGYKPSFTYVMSTNKQTWSGGWERMFFLKSRGGQLYAKINVSVAINQEPEDLASVEIEGRANTNGSLNFEADAVVQAAYMKAN